MKEQIMVFSKEWFKKYNKTLCWFANTPIIKYWFRKLICIDNSVLWSEKIEKITPSSFTYGKKLVLIRGKLRWIQTTDFRTKRVFAKELYNKLKPLWYLIHFWDYLTLSNPKFNLGFDTLTEYSESGTAGDTCDGCTQYSGSKTFSDIRSASGNYHDDTGNYVIAHIRCYDTNGNFDNMTRGNCSFDTSELESGDTITGAKLSLFNWINEDYLGTDYSIHICKSTQANNNSLSDSDYSKYEDTSFGSIDRDDIGYGYNEITLNASGIGNISKTGVSKFGVRTSWDINNNFDGTWKQYSYGGSTFYSADYSSSMAPKLVITYTPPVVAPTVTTQDADQIATTSIRGNGNITATGGANATRRGFCYKAGTTGDPTTSDSVAYDDGSFGTGAFNKSITGLTPNTSYRVRAYAVNSAGTSYGTTVDVTTLKAFKPRTMWFN